MCFDHNRKLPITRIMFTMCLCYLHDLASPSIVTLAAHSLTPFDVVVVYSKTIDAQRDHHVSLLCSYAVNGEIVYWTMFQCVIAMIVESINFAPKSVVSSQIGSSVTLSVWLYSIECMHVLFFFFQYSVSIVWHDLMNISILYIIYTRT